MDAKITEDKASSVRADLVSALTAIREPETIVATVSTPMITPTLLRARSLDEPGEGMPYAGISRSSGGPTLMAQTFIQQ